MKLPPQDKQMHFLTAYVGASMVQRFVGNRLIAAGALLIAAACKEGLDAWANYRARRKGLPEPHSVEFLDFVASALGGVLGAFM